MPGRPPRGRARHPRPLRAHRPTARLAVGAGAAAGADRRRAGGCGGSRRRGAEPGQPFRDRLRSGISRRQLGLPLVESADLMVRDGRLWMRSLGTVEPVDVVLRRVDAAWPDPLDLRPDSRLGVVGLIEVLRRGAVTVVNTLGSGVLENPGLLPYLPALARELLGEEPTLTWCRRSGVVDRPTGRTCWPTSTRWCCAPPGRARPSCRHCRMLPAKTAGGNGSRRNPAVGRSAAGHLLRGPGGRGRRVVGGPGGHAPVHRRAPGRVRGDGRRTRLSPGPRQPRIPDEYRCRQG